MDGEMRMQKLRENVFSKSKRGRGMRLFIYGSRRKLSESIVVVVNDDGLLKIWIFYFIRIIHVQNFSTRIAITGVISITTKIALEKQKSSSNEVISDVIKYYLGFWMTYLITLKRE